METKIQKSKKEDSDLISKKLESQLDFLVEGQKINRDELQLGFIGLVQQNQELLELNKQLT